MHNIRLYKIYYHMKSRCYNKNEKNYKQYGGRGITICDEWLNDFTAFYNWSIENGYRNDLSIDRIDNNKGYSPDNCRWANYKIQNRNRRGNKYYTINGKTCCLAEWCEILNLNQWTVRSRLRRGSSIEKALGLEVKNP